MISNTPIITVVRERLYNCSLGLAPLAVHRHAITAEQLKDASKPSLAVAVAHLRKPRASHRTQMLFGEMAALSAAAISQPMDGAGLREFRAAIFSQLQPGPVGRRSAAQTWIDAVLDAHVGLGGSTMGLVNDMLRLVKELDVTCTRPASWASGGERLGHFAELHLGGWVVRELTEWDETPAKIERLPWRAVDAIVDPLRKEVRHPAGSHELCERLREIHTEVRTECDSADWVRHVLPMSCVGARSSNTGVAMSGAEGSGARTVVVFDDDLAIEWRGLGMSPDEIDPDMWASVLRGERDRLLGAFDPVSGISADTEAVVVIGVDGTSILVRRRAGFVEALRVARGSSGPPQDALLGRLRWGPFGEPVDVSAYLGS